MFRLTPDADTAGTCGVGLVRLSPAVLLAWFGPPGRSSADGKVSGWYTFTSDTGDVFTLYDYKETTLYYGEETGRPWPTPAEFWAGTRPVELNIGGRSAGTGPNPAVIAFRYWLLDVTQGDDPRVVTGTTGEGR